MSLSAGELLDPARALRDLATLGLGEDLPTHVRVMPLDKLWTRMARADATAFLVRIIGHDLAYSNRVLDKVEAVRITNAFVGLFSDEAVFFNSFELGADGFPSSGTPFLGATMEAGVGVYDGSRAGILLVTGED